MSSLPWMASHRGSTPVLTQPRIFLGPQPTYVAASSTLACFEPFGPIGGGMGGWVGVVFMIACSEIRI